MVQLALLSSCQTTRIDAQDPGSYSKEYYDTPLWSVAIRYPDGYDWMKDPLGGDVGAWILLFRDTTKILQLEASADGPICPDVDKHRVIGGHLYSHFTSGEGRTLMLLDGKELFSFEGSESIDCILVKGSDVYTLGQGIYSGGWSFRKNGELLIGQDSGRLLSPLYEDMGEICFSWAMPITSTSGQTAWRYYSYFGENRSQLSVSSDITNVYSIRRHKGQVNYLATSNVIKGILWENGKTSISLAGTEENVVDASFVLIGDRIHIFLTQRFTYLTFSFWLDGWWNETGNVVMTDAPRQLCSISKDSPALYFATSAWAGIDNVRIWKDGEEYSLPSQYCMVSPNSLCCNEKYHYIALNDFSDAKKRPLLIHRGDTSKFDFNGYFTELSLP